jgi:hypothetical protein
MNEYYERKKKDGLEYQDFIVDKLCEIGIPILCYSSLKYQYNVGESKGGIEIKLDDRLAETGNLYIEVSEKSNSKNKDYISSGIYRNDNTWLYIIGNYKVIYIFAKLHLRMVYEDISREKFFRRVQTPTSQGFLLPAKYAEEKLAAKVIKL